MHSNPIDETFKEMKGPIKGAANAVAISQLALNLVVSMGMGIFIGMIETLNIVCFSSMFH